MTKSALYTFVTGLLDGYPMDTTQFDAFLDVAQSNVENMRPWVTLRDVDSSVTISTNATYATENTLPTNFRKTYTRFALQLADSQGNILVRCREVPFPDRMGNKGDVTKFWINYATKKFGVCGAPSQSLTAHLSYIKRGTKISTADSQEWDLDVNDEYTKVLGFLIAVYFKLGVDYDIINNAQGNANAGVAAAIIASMTEWDGDLQLGMLSGQDYGMNYGISGNTDGGNVNFL